MSASFGASEGQGLFCDHAGRIQIYRDLPGALERLAEKRLSAPAKKGEKNQRLLCALSFAKCNEELTWLLGDEHGTIHLVQLLGTDEHRNVHEGKVLSLLSLPETGEFLSSGADGIIVRHRLEADSKWTQLAVHRPGCGLKHLSHLVLNGREGTAPVPPLLIGAFQSADFVLWDSLAGLEIWRTRCGGAKRPNGLMADTKSFTFMFSSGSKALEIYSTFNENRPNTENQETLNAAQGLRRPLHGREIHQICWLQMPTDESGGFLATASEDTSMRLLQCGPLDSLQLTPDSFSVRFSGSVRALAAAALSGRKILVSGGSKGEIKVHLFGPSQLPPLQLCWSSSLRKVDPIEVRLEDEELEEEKDEEDDKDEEKKDEERVEGKVDESISYLEERVMALSCTKLDEDSTFLLAAASSSGYLRSWRLQLTQSDSLEVSFLQRQRVCNTTALCMEVCQTSSHLGIFVGSADGKLTACKAGRKADEAGISICVHLALHDAGINDLAIQEFQELEEPNPAILVLSAGDDHHMGLWRFEAKELQLVGSRLIEAWGAEWLE